MLGVQRVGACPCRGALVNVSAVEECTAVSVSVCTACTFWHRPTADGTGCETHAVQWVIINVVAAVAVASTVVAFLCILESIREYSRPKTIASL